MENVEDDQRPIYCFRPGKGWYSVMDLYIPVSNLALGGVYFQNVPVFSHLSKHGCYSRCFKG